MTARSVFALVDAVKLSIVTMEFVLATLDMLANFAISQLAQSSATKMDIALMVSAIANPGLLVMTALRRSAHQVAVTTVFARIQPAVVPFRTTMVSIAR